MDARSTSKTRRFHSHGEAIKWSFGSLTRWWAKLLPVCLLGVSIQFAANFLLTNQFPDVESIAIFFVGFPLAMWLLVAPVIYVCVVLAGGIMSREERVLREEKSPGVRP